MRPTLSPRDRLREQSGRPHYTSGLWATIPSQPRTLHFLNKSFSATTNALVGIIGSPRPFSQNNVRQRQRPKRWSLQAILQKFQIPWHWPPLKELWRRNNQASCFLISVCFLSLSLSFPLFTSPPLLSLLQTSVFIKKKKTMISQKVPVLAAKNKISSFKFNTHTHKKLKTFKECLCSVTA